jgi:hypothetical protein
VNPIMTIFKMATHLWYATVSKEKMRGGHPGVAGPSSSDDYDNEIGHLEGIYQTIKDIYYAKKEMMSETHNSNLQYEKKKIR